MDRKIALNAFISTTSLFTMIRTESIILYILSFILVIYANVNIIKMAIKIRKEGR